MALFYLALALGTVTTIVIVAAWSMQRSSRGDIQSAFTGLHLGRNSPAVSSKRLLEVAARAQSRLRVVCGGCDPAVYTPEVVARLRELATRADLPVRVSFVTGSEFRKDAEGVNPVEELALQLKEQGNSYFSLKKLSDYPSGGHVRIADGKHCCLEMPHAKDSPRTGRLISEVLDDVRVAEKAEEYFAELDGVAS